MLQALLKRHERDEEGFTLIELMVVVLIIAILIAIAIPTFLGAQDRARDRGAQSNVRNSLTAAKTIATDFEGRFASAVSGASCTPITPTDMGLVEGALSFAATGAKDTIGVSVSPLCSEIILITQSNSDKWYAIWADKKGQTMYCKNAAQAAVPTGWPALADDTLDFTATAGCSTKW